MEKEIIKTSLLNPSIIPDVLESGVIGIEHEKHLENIYKTYLKTKQIPSKEVIKHYFNFDIDLVNKADIELVYDEMKEYNLAKYNFSIEDRIADLTKTITPEYIKELNKKYIKDYSSKTENRFTLDDVAGVIKLKKEIDNKEEEFITTGFYSINNLTKGNNNKLPGGWRPGSLYSIMGLSGYGKSIFLTNFARDVWSRNNNVLYISTEMDHLETFERILKSFYQVEKFEDIATIMKGSKFPESKIEVIKVHPNDTTYLDIQKIIDELDWIPDVLFIDYADELKSHEKSNNEYEGQGIIYSGLKKLAEIYNIPVITATQTNRAAEDTEKGGTRNWVGMGAIADSTKKIRLVDMLLSITQSVEEKIENKINLLVLKNRFGKSNIKIGFYIDYKKMLLREIPAPVDKIITPVKKEETILVDVELNKKGKI